MKNPAIKLQLLTTVLGLLVGSSPAAACTCAGMRQSGCDTTWANGEFIFVGTVASKLGGEKHLGNGIVEHTEYKVQFSSVEILRGLIRSDEVIALHTGHGDGDCGYPFIVGKRYLVYAVKSEDRLTTGICTQTGPAEMASATIVELRKLRDQERSDELFGNIGTAPDGASFESLFTIQPLSGVAADLTGEHNLRLRTFTNEQGGYVFASIPSGEYSIGEGLPPGLHRSSNRVAHLPNTEGHPGCRVDSFPKPDGRISGRVTDASGAGLAGFITLEPSDPEESIRARQRGGLPGEDTDDGRFSLELLPPGTYRLLFHQKRGDRINLQEAAVWPRSGSGLTLGFGEHLDDLKVEVLIGKGGQIQ